MNKASKRWLSLSAASGSSTLLTVAMILLYAHSH